MPFDSGFLEWADDEFVPLLHHVADGVALTTDGSLMAVIHVPGFPFELEAPHERNLRRNQLNVLLRNIADDNITVTANLCHHDGVEPMPRSRFSSKLARRVHERYEALRLHGRMMRNDWYLTLSVSPRAPMEQSLRRSMTGLFGAKRPRKAKADEVRALEDRVYVVLKFLQRCGARRLGYRPDAKGLRHSEIAEAMRLVLTGRWKPVPVVHGSLGAAIYTERAICTLRGVELRGAGPSRYAMMFGFKEYPQYRETGMLNGLLSAPYPFVLSQSFRFQSRAAAQMNLWLRQVRMENAGDKAVSQIKQLAQEQDDVASGLSVQGDHHLSLAVYADTPDALLMVAADADTRLTQAGAVAAREDRGTFGAYWSQLPCSADWLKTRPGDVSSLEFTAYTSLDSYPEGAQRGWWGWVMRFRTMGGTAYDYQPHVGDVGHTLVIGKMSSGKTIWMLMLALGLERVMQNRPGTVVFLDKDRGAEIAIRAAGGRYLTFKSGEASGVAPLRGLTDTPADRAFLVRWLTSLIMLDGKRGLTHTEEAALARGVARQMAMPPELRSLVGVRQFMGFSDDPEDAGGRLEKWCRGGALGWAFDNDADDIRLDARMVGFDLTALFGAPDICAATAAYLLYRIRSLIDGRRLAVIWDEVKFSLAVPAFFGIIDDFSVTMRKKNGMLVLGAQQPDHITKSGIGPALVSQCETKILFPVKSARYDDYVGDLKCTVPEFKAVSEVIPTHPVRSFLLKRDDGSVICEMDLSGMDDEIAILSGREETVRLLDAIRAEVGDDPDAWLPVFLKRYPEVTEVLS